MVEYYDGRPVRRGARWGWLLLAAIFAAMLAAVYAGVKPAGAHLVWQMHAEGVSLSTYGKWAGPDWPVDGLSGEFPSFYNYLSDYFLSWLAAALDQPNFHVQALIYGPVLAGAMLFVNYLCLSTVLESRLQALVASVLISWGTDLTIPDAVYAYFGEANVTVMKAKMHVPFLAMPLATGQSLGWFLLVPVLTLVLHAWTRDSMPWAFAAGAGLGVLFQAHSLTFVNVSFATCLFIYASSLVGTRSRRAAFLARCVVPAAVFLALSWAASHRPQGFSLHFMAALWMVLLLASITSARRFAVLAAMGTGALLACAHYALHLFNNRDSLALLNSANVGGMLWLPSVLLYFLPFWLVAAGLVLSMRWRSSPQLLWALCMLLATFALSVGRYWGYENHPYRMSINLIFPLSILFAAFSLHPGTSLRISALWIGPLLALSLLAVGRNVLVLYGKVAAVERLGTLPRYFVLAAPTPEETTFMTALATHLRGEGRVLLPPEHNYPDGIKENSLILGVSQIPGFIPDYRFIGWPDLYAQRVRFYCALFPGFPHWDTPVFTQSRANERLCQQRAIPLQAGSPIAVLDPKLRADVLPLYAIRFVAHWTPRIAEPYREIAASYGLRAIHDGPGKGLFAFDAASMPDDRTSFGKAAYTRDGRIHFTAQASRPGCFTFVLAGPDIAHFARAIQVNGVQARPASAGNDVLLFGSTLPHGSSRIDLLVERDERYATVMPTPIFFATGVLASEFEQKFRVQDPALTASAGCAASS